jgi:glycosyltransferase involved in cell wall biosynthesis
MDYLTLVSCIKNEAHHVAEWLAYYKSVGVEKFIIYNNMSNDETEDVINDLPFRDDINLIEFNPTNPDRQGLAYQMAQQKYKGKTEWMLFCDSDEFFMPSVKQDLREFVSNYKAFSGFGATWQIYGSSGHILRPSGGVLNNFLYKADVDWDPNLHVKVIIKPNEVFAGFTSTGYITPHMWDTRNGVVDEDGEIIDHKQKGKIKKVKINKIRVNHYFNRSYEDWIDKRRRGRATIKEKRPLEMFDVYDKNDIYDDIALQYVEDLKQYL